MDRATGLLAGGNGLRGMRERVHAMGGRFAVTSEGPGTTLVVELPVANGIQHAREQSAGLVEA